MAQISVGSNSTAQSTYKVLANFNLGDVGGNPTPTLINDVNRPNRNISSVTRTSSSTISVNYGGVSNINLGSDVLVFTFSTPLPNINYKVDISPFEAASNAANPTVGWSVLQRTVNSCTIRFTENVPTLQNFGGIFSVEPLA